MKNKENKSLIIEFNNFFGEYQKEWDKFSQNYMLFYTNGDIDENKIVMFNKIGDIIMNNIRFLSQLKKEPQKIVSFYDDKFLTGGVGISMLQDLKGINKQLIQIMNEKDTIKKDKIIKEENMVKKNEIIKEKNKVEGNNVERNKLKIDKNFINKIKKIEENRIKKNKNISSEIINNNFNELTEEFDKNIKKEQNIQQIF